MLKQLSTRLPSHLPLLFSILLLFRAGFIWLNDLDLVGDESYYWDWSRQPAWCYYSKPPMVAWIIGAITWLLGDSVFVVRFGAVLLGTAFLVVFYATAKRFYSANAAAIALLLLLATPANALSNVIMSIDPPLCFFWIATLYFLHAALFSDKSVHWCYAGIMTGLACLSKPVAFLLPLLLVLYIVCQGQWRLYWKQLLGYYLIPVMISLIPIVLWNVQHDWVTFQHGQSHFEAPRGFDITKRLGDFAEFIGLQLLLWTPLTWLLLLVSSVTACWHYARFTAPEQLLIIMGPVALMVVMALSLRQKVQANWPMPFYFSGFILLAGRLAQGQWLTYYRPAFYTGLVMVMLAYSAPFIIPLMGLSGTAYDPAKRLQGWQTFASQLNTTRSQIFPDQQTHLLLVNEHRDFVSELAFYLPDHPHIFHIVDSGKVESQYEIWPGPKLDPEQSALVLSQKKPQQFQQSLAHAWAEIALVDTLPAPSSKDPHHIYYLYLTKNIRIWPIKAL